MPYSAECGPQTVPSAPCGCGFLTSFPAAEPCNLQQILDHIVPPVPGDVTASSSSSSASGVNSSPDFP